MSNKPKYLEFDILKVIETKELVIIDQVRKDDEGFYYQAEKVSSNPLDSTDKLVFREDELILSSSQDRKKVIPLGSIFEPEEVQFLLRFGPIKLDKIPLTKASAGFLLRFLYDSVFEMELSKDKKADDAVLSFLVRIITKLSNLTSMKTDVLSSYYNHLFKKMIAKGNHPDVSDIGDLLARMLEAGDYSSLLIVGSVCLYSNPGDYKKAYSSFAIAAEHGVNEAFVSMALLHLNRKNSDFFDPDYALSLLAAPLGLGDSPALYVASNIVFSFRCAIKDVSYAFNMCLKAYREEIGYLLDGFNNVLVPEECYLLGKIIKSGRSKFNYRKEALMFFLIGLASLHIRTDKPAHLAFNDRGKLSDKIARELKTFTKEELNEFSSSKVNSPLDGLRNIVYQEHNHYLIDNIEQDISEKHLKITMTLQNNVIPFLDEANVVHLCDKIIIRVKGAKPVKGLKTRFYMGLIYKMQVQEHMGEVFFSFDDKGGFGDFVVEGDNYTVSFTEWKGPLRPFKKDIN